MLLIEAYEEMKDSVAGFEIAYQHEVKTYFLAFLVGMIGNLELTEEQSERLLKYIKEMQP